MFFNQGIVKINRMNLFVSFVPEKHMKNLWTFTLTKKRVSRDFSLEKIGFPFAKIFE